MAKRIRVEMEAFVEAWEASKSVTEVATKLGIKATSVAARASKYRSAPFNIPLKAMQRIGAAKLDITAARELLAKLRGTTVEAVAAESNVLAAKHAVRAQKSAAAAASIAAATGVKTE
jgi:hypothetical protein